MDQNILLQLGQLGEEIRDMRRRMTNIRRSL